MPVKKMNIVGEPAVLWLGAEHMYTHNRRHTYLDEHKNPKPEFIACIFEKLATLFEKQYPDVVEMLQTSKDNTMEYQTIRHIIARAIISGTHLFATTETLKSFFGKYFNESIYTYMIKNFQQNVFENDHAKEYKKYYKFFYSFFRETYIREREYTKRLDDFEKIKKKYKLLSWRTDTKTKRHLYLHTRVFKEINTMYSFLEEYTHVSKAEILSENCSLTVTYCRGVFLMYFKKKYPSLPSQILTKFVFRKRKHMLRWNKLYSLYKGIRSNTDEAKDFFTLYNNIISDMHYRYPVDP